MVQLHMRLSSLEGEFPARLDPGYTVRTCSEEDVPGLARVISVAFQEEWSHERTHKEFFANPSVYRTFAIEYDGEIVATASVQMFEKDAPDMGTIHYVAALPSHAGHRLGSEVCLAVLREMKAMGCKRANLTTDDPRLPAIRTYLKLGFEPFYCDESHPARWAAVLAKVSVPHE